MSDFENGVSLCVNCDARLNAPDSLPKVVYVASPYSHESTSVRELRYKQVEAFTAELLKKGYVVFSPIVHCHQLGISFNLPTDFKFWANYCLTMLAKSDVLWVLQLDGWRESVGVQHEVEFAGYRNITTVHEVDVQRFVEGVAL